MLVLIPSYALLAESRQLGRKNFHHGILNEMARECKNGLKKAQKAQKAQKNEKMQGRLILMFDVQPRKTTGFPAKQDLDFSDVRKFTPGTHKGLLLLRLPEAGRKIREKWFPRIIDL